MKSPLPKVVHPVAGVPMIQRVVQAAFQAGCSEVRVVVGHGQQLVRQIVEPLGATCFEQKEQKGTGDAVRAAQIESIDGLVMILNGDHPLLTTSDLKSFVEEHKLSQIKGRTQLSVVTAELEQPGSYGRIVRSGGQIQAIVEAKDASDEVLKIREINTGIYLSDAKDLKKNLDQVSNKNAQGEYYLTDIVRLSLEAKEKVGTISGRAHVAKGVNDQIELAEVTKAVFKRKAEALMAEGVMIIDPANVYIEDTVQVGPASVVYPGVFLRGTTQVGAFCVLEPHVFISDSQIADSVKIRAGSYLEQAQVAASCTVGPYARLRPETVLEEDSHIGNFVELKKVRFGKGSKAGHLTYLGDAEIGEGTNIGCGTITCNYAADKKKYKTIIGKNVFVGSDSQFVAPVKIGDNAVIGSGSTITKDVPEGALGVARARQMVKENYSPKKK